MQKSTSFSDARTGKPRPSNLLSTREGQSESLPWPSPSFDIHSHKMNTTINTSVSADPGRPSTQAKTSPTDGLPPTPLTATYKQPTYGEKDGHLRLPSVRDMLSHTPPESHSARTVELPSEHVHHVPHHRHEHLPSSAAAAAAASTSYRPTSSSMRDDLLPIVQRRDAQMMSLPSPRNADFHNMPKSEEVQGLGLDLSGTNGVGEETPRLGHMDWSSMRTPTLAQSAPHMPGAPRLTGSDAGRLDDMITSPINPPLRNWNTDLRFEDRAPAMPSSRPSIGQRSFSDAPMHSSMSSFTAMERERAMDIEAGMPQGHKLWGLAMSMDNGDSYRRGGYLYRQDGSIVGPAAMVRSSTGPHSASGPMENPPTPARRHVAPLPSSSSKATPNAASSSSSSSHPSAPYSAGKAHLKTTGLTPHIHKTRLTPSFSTRSSAGKNGNVSPTSNGESPSLKMKSKQRSEQLRTQAAHVAAQENMPSEHVSVLGQQASAAAAASNAQSSSPLRPDSMPVSPIGASGGRSSLPNVQAYISPPKRGSQGRSPAATANEGPVDDVASSPWGVFELGSNNSSWQPLGPPALSNVLGKLNLDEAGDDDEEEDDDLIKGRSSKAKRARKTPLGSNAASRNASPAMMAVAGVQRPASPFIKRRGTPNSADSSAEEKENDVFGSLSLAHTGGARASASPNKQAPSQGQRRLLSIR